MDRTVIRRFASRLHNLRIERNLTQEALAASARLNTSYVSALERARKIPSLSTLEQLATGLGVDLATLIDFPSERATADDRKRDEIGLLLRRLNTCDFQTVRKIRRAVEILTSK